jgi:hypothetical protein
LALNAPLSRRRLMAAGAVCWVSGQSNATAQDASEGIELLRAIKRVIDEDLIDQPEKASEILGLQITDYLGPNEEVRPSPIIGVTRPRKLFADLQASIIASDQPQRVTFGIVELVVNGFAEGVPSASWISDATVREVFGEQFHLASRYVRPMWRPGTDFTGWSGNFPNDTMVYPLKQGNQIEMTARFGSQTQLARITLRTKRKGAK